MDVYKKTNSPYWYFAPTLSVGGARRQHPISTYLKDQRAAREVMRKTVLLAESVEAQVPLMPELRRWLEAMNPKLRKKLVALGLVDDRDAAAADSIEQHIEDYLADCLANGHGNDFVKIKRSQLKSLLKHAAAKRLSDLTPDAVSRFLASLIEAGKSHRTRNQHRASAVSWLNWCVDRGRLDGHRVNRIGRLNEKIDRRRHRRAATDDEIERLLESCPSTDGSYSWERSSRVCVGAR